MAPKKRYLQPIAVVIAALLSTITNADARQETQVGPDDSGNSTGMRSEEGRPSPDPLLLQRVDNDDAVNLDHYSHRSHRSHSSHRSHYSGY